MENCSGIQIRDLELKTQTKQLALIREGDIQASHVHVGLLTSR